MSIKIFILIILLTQFFTFSCKSSSNYYSVEDFNTLLKIDAHVHVNTDDQAFIETALADNFSLVTVNVDYSDFPPIEKQLSVAVNLITRHPDRVKFFSTFHMSGWDSENWQEKTNAHLDSTFKLGAVGVKVWKNIGMDFHDAAGNNIMIDHEKFDPVFKFIKQQNKVLLGHQGEPKNCWLPLEEMTVNNDREYFKNHPNYHMYLHPELPSYEDQMAARNRMLDKNPQLKFVGAHMASLEWSVDELANFLDRYPNAVVDLAARLGQVQYQSSKNLKKVIDFFIKYQDRILYATDLTQNPGATTEELKDAFHKKWLEDWTYLVTSETLIVPELDEPFKGLKLPASVITKIYHDNAAKLFNF